MSIPCTLTEFDRAILAMTLLSKAQPFTSAELRTWYGALACYEAATIVECVRMVAAGPNRDPSFCELFQACRSIEPPPDGDGTGPLTDWERNGMARRLGLEI